ncbi:MULTISPECIES: hypothetical protein [unclassified Ensifer]|uniref:hypothetical protein n=1 Tax=unclassified Ensifer TaxID=2633371 RepID=UPI000A84AF0F|nr:MULTISPECIES: hypothetical protein [unclassified Ensifer]
MKKLVRILLTIVVPATAVLGFRWYQYVDNRESPFDEVGIALNAAMPGPINLWGCDRLKLTSRNAARLRHRRWSEVEIDWH